MPILWKTGKTKNTHNQRRMEKNAKEKILMGKYDDKFNGYNGNTAQYLILVAIANELAELNKNLKR